MRTDLPFLISFPRTGSHWMTTVIELYLDKPYFCPGDPRQRVTFLDRNRDDYGWSHEHDEDSNTINLKDGNVLYLYREPVDVVFSLTMYKLYEQRRDDYVYFKPDFHNNTATIMNIATNYRNHLIKWLLSEFKAKAFVRYDRFRSDSRNDEFKKVCHFFDVPFEEEKVEAAFNGVTKEKIGNDPYCYKQAMNEHIQSEYYSEHRENFRVLYGDILRSRIYVPELIPYFK